MKYFKFLSANIILSSLSVLYKCCRADRTVDAQLYS